MEIEKLAEAEYSPEFMEQAVRTHQESGLSEAEITYRLSIPPSEDYFFGGRQAWGIINRLCMTILHATHCISTLIGA